MTPYIEELQRGMDEKTRREFREPQQIILQRSLELCGMTELPPVTGDPDGVRCSAEMICDRCGRVYYSHPMDWRVIGQVTAPHAAAPERCGATAAAAGAAD